MACAHSSDPSASPDNTSVQIPRDCERLAEHGELPDVTKGQSAKVALGQHRSALIGAYGSLDATRECQVNQRERFSKGAQ